MAILHIVDSNYYLHSTIFVLQGTPSVEMIVKQCYLRLKRMADSVGRDDKIVFAFDGESARANQSAILEGYKGQRAERSDDVKAAIKHMRYVMRYRGYPVMYDKEKEADQTIASLALKVADKGSRVLIHSRDKDFNQLISKNIRIKDSKSHEIRNIAHVKERYGISPRQFAFYLTLVGDAIDGVSGLAGCGHVGAVKLIKKYKSFDNAKAVLSENSFAFKGLEAAFNKHLDHLLSCYEVVKLGRLETTKMPKAKQDLDRLKAYCDKHGLDYRWLFSMSKF